MVEQARRYRSDDAKVDVFDENTGNHRVALHKLRRSARTDSHAENSVPLFLSDPGGEPDSSEYVVPLLKKGKASLSLRILSGVCATAAAAALVALFSSDTAWNRVVNVKASMAAVFPPPSSVARSDPTQLTSLDRLKDPVRLSAPENQAPLENRAPGARGVTTASVAPARENVNVNNADQSALQGRSVAPVAGAELTTREEAIHHLDPDVIAALLRRADALITSGDVAAARLVLRRAADAGDAGAAMALAGTYDPTNLAKLGVHGIVPDVAMARSWYEKARKFGSAEAPQRLEMLANKRQ